ncbi:hypothetical protein [Streptomyces sp. NPDC088707]|uniref:hypothetical protein n=1 Tax=Streptomyces sp. NPDC088707 TaxID=3365871 RepID=UPI003828BC5B
MPGASEDDPLPITGLAQLYAGDVPDLPAGPDGADLLQTFWRPYGMLLHVR